MALKIRLARHGRKSFAYYHIVVADSRSPRDGRFVERIGSYNPNTNPATIDLDFDKALTWLQNGAQPSDTCRLILSYKGVMMKKHLLEGVTKGAFDANEAELRFEKWMKEKAAKVAAKVDRLSSEKNAEEKQKHAAEVKVKEERAQALARKYAEEAAAQKAAEEAAEAAAEEAVEAVAEESAEAAEEKAPENE
ncbi:MAG TPA: 30S ribosomal protein S16 [Bacteroidales bacterium]|nr:30S ribosomal protein S16 [Bacteroidales bacterium]HOE03627.1 30S ribosomal protein S16 [Bacteroidales bacterium]HQL69313.1 30S ribosomal protein S16 [Bacteroidales bacterium]